MSYLGDFHPGQTVSRLFNTRQADGTPITLAGTPAISVYKDGGTTESTAGVNLTVDFDSRTGLHLVTIDTSAAGTFYAAGSDFELVVTAGTVAGVSVVGTSLGTFSLENRSALRSEVAGRTLAISAAGVVDANLVQHLGLASPTPEVAGVPIVDIGYVGGEVATPDQGIVLSAGTTNAGGTATEFTATIAGSTLSATTGAYDGMTLLFQGGNRNGEAGVISTYAVADGIATFTFPSGQAFTGAPGDGDPFLVG